MPCLEPVLMMTDLSIRRIQKHFQNIWETTNGFSWWIITGTNVCCTFTILRKIYMPIGLDVEIGLTQRHSPQRSCANYPTHPSSCPMDQCQRCSREQKPAMPHTEKKHRVRQEMGVRSMLSSSLPRMAKRREEERRSSFTKTDIPRGDACAWCSPRPTCQERGP